MVNNRFYLIKSSEPPIHPIDLFEDMWINSQLWTQSLFYNEDISYNCWKQKEMIIYKKALDLFNTKGYNIVLKHIYSTASKTEIHNIENQSNFIKWILN